MPEQIVLQKLLNASLASAIVQNGADVGGYVALTSAVAGLRTPAKCWELSVWRVHRSPSMWCVSSSRA